MTTNQKLPHCAGCRDNFYNRGKDDLCWMLAAMKLVWKKPVPVDQRPPWDNPAVRLPNCYRRKGYVYVDPKITR